MKTAEPKSVHELARGGVVFTFAAFEEVAGRGTTRVCVERSYNGEPTGIWSYVSPESARQWYARLLREGYARV